MDRFMILAALVMLGTTALHLFAGTVEIMLPIMASDLHQVISATAMVVWHVITLLLALMFIALWSLAQRPNPQLWLFVFAINLTFIAVFMAANLFVFGTIWTMPQWTLFALCAAFMLLSLRNKDVWSS